jgi:hypothetical protein
MSSKNVEVDSNEVEMNEEFDNDVSIAKPPSKARASAKSSGDKAPSKKKATNAEATAKRTAEQLRHSEACGQAVKENLTSYYVSLTDNSFIESAAKTLNNSILEGVKELQAASLQLANPYDAFPADVYKLSAEPKVSHSKGKQSTKSNVKPTTKPRVIRKGGKAPEPVEPVEPEESEPSEETDVVSGGDVEEKPAAPKAKKNVAIITAYCKKALAFLISKLTDEACDLADSGVKIKNKEEFVKQVFSNETLSSRNKILVLRSVVSTVNKYNSKILNSDDKLADKYVALVQGDSILDKTQTHLAKIVSVYLSDYIKILGNIVANLIWVSKKQINHTTIESAIRTADYANYDPTGDQSSKICEGFFNNLKRYVSLVMPPKPAPRRKKKDDESSDGSEPSTKGRKSKAAKEPKETKETKAKAKARKVEQVVEYEDDGDENEEEEVEEEVEEEEEIEEEEEEVEEEPPKKRSLKKTTK